MSWKACHYFFNFLAAQPRCARACTESRESGNGIGYEFHRMRPFPSGSKDDSAIFYVSVQRIPGTDVETTTQWAGKNYLALRGNSGLHGKTILPQLPERK